jgi:2-aminobenzoate-CoA ligase
MVACWLAATKVGAVVVNTMPLLRKKELSEIIDKAEISHILCDTRLIEEVEYSGKEHSCVKFVIPFDGSANHNSELDKVALEKSIHF